MKWKEYKKKEGKKRKTLSKVECKLISDSTETTIIQSKESKINAFEEQ